MADKDAKPFDSAQGKPADKPALAPEPLAVDVISSIPLSVQIAPESLASLGAPPAGTADPVTAVAGSPLGTGTPVNMTVMAPSPPPVTVTKGEGTTLSPTTTEQEDLVAERQQDVNILWETTQSRIALVVVFAGVLVNAVIIVMIVFLNREVTVTQLSLISICLQFINLTAGIIIGFYFSRTNHQARGGVGSKPVEDYQGR